MVKMYATSLMIFNNHCYRCKYTF